MFESFLCPSSFFLPFYFTLGSGLLQSPKDKVDLLSFSRPTSVFDGIPKSSDRSLANQPTSNSSLVSADEDFHYINKQNLGDYVNQSVVHEESFKKRPSRFTEFLEKLTFDSKSSNEFTSHLRWFKLRPKRKQLYASVSNVCSKIVEENGDSNFNYCEKPVAVHRKKPESRCRSRSEHDLCSETISRICPTTGICTIDRGSQTDIKPKKMLKTW